MRGPFLSLFWDRLPSVLCSCCCSCCLCCCCCVDPARSSTFACPRLLRLSSCVCRGNRLCSVLLRTAACCTSTNRLTRTCKKRPLHCCVVLCWSVAVLCCLGLCCVALDCSGHVRAGVVCIAAVAAGERKVQDPEGPKPESTPTVRNLPRAHAPARTCVCCVVRYLCCQAEQRRVPVMRFGRDAGCCPCRGACMQHSSLSRGTAQRSTAQQTGGRGAASRCRRFAPAVGPSTAAARLI